jgi:hypothetical protein
MKGYFSSLIKHTGITFQSNRSSKKVPFGKSPKESKDYTEITPIHVEERRLIEPWSERAIGRTSMNKDNTAVTPAQVIREERTQHSAGHLYDKGSKHKEDQVVEKNHEGQRNDYHVSPVQVLEKMYIQQSIDGKGDERFIQEERKVTFIDSARPSSEKSQPPHEINRVELLENKEMRTTDSGAKEYVRKAEKPVDQVDHEAKKVTPSKFGTGSDNRESSLKEVREWVAETSIANGEEISNIEIIKTENTERRVSEREIYAPQYAKPIGSHQDREPQIHDFHLSIGTISLTIEGSQQKIQSDKSEQKIRRNEISTKENNSSRLHRHYIRI